MNSSSRVLVCFSLFLAGLFCRAGVTVTENVSPGATSWPGSPIVSTMANPSSTATLPEGFNGGSGNTNLSQTFTITTTNYTLQTIDIYAGTGSGTGSGTNLVLRLFDLGVQASSPNPYTAGVNLFGSGAGLSVSYVSQTAGVLEFDFTGADQVTLTNGHMYVFELTGVSNTTPVMWYRARSDTYSGGAAYRNRHLINGNQRDFALAVYTTANATNPPVSAPCTVDWNDLHQRIDGFGGGVVFLNPGTLDPVTDANANTLFGTANANQLGLTLLRVRIDPTTNWSNALLDGQKAVARGAGVLATPWTPPASMKDNGGLTNGSLLPEQYANYASYLNNFAGYMSSNGAPLRAISVQNEPDWPATYESCLWNSSQFLSFFRTNASAIGSTPVMMPESLGFNPVYSDATLNDPVAVTNVDIIGGHLYGVTVIPANTNALAHNKPIWMTEFLVNTQTISSAIITGRQIHDCLTVGNMSAYIWWKCLGDANGLVDASGVPQRRGFVMAQWSRFVRTNYYRIGVINTNNIGITAFKIPGGSAFTIVALNTNDSVSVNQTFNLTNFTAATVTPWITSDTQSLAVQPDVTLTNGSFTYTLAPLSIVTFVGQSGAPATNTPPAFVAVASLATNVGATLRITNTVVDPDVPTQTLTFSLLLAPTNAMLTSLGASNAVFIWRPLVSQANTTNAIMIKVADNGSPVSNATNSFSITVNPLGQSSLNSITAAGGLLTLGATGPVGPDYSLWTSTNLFNWQFLYMTNPLVTSFILTDTNATDAARFYRIQIGP